MPVKKRKSRKSAQLRELPHTWFFDFLLGYSNHQKYHISESARRHAYFTYRDQIFNEDYVKGCPGQRPAAWWAYEAGIPEPMGSFLQRVDHWEGLLWMDAMDEGEKQSVLSELLKVIELSRGPLSVDYDGRLFEQLERQAHHAAAGIPGGHAAVRVFEKIIKEVIENDNS